MVFFRPILYPIIPIPTLLSKYFLEINETNLFFLRMNITKN